MTSVDRGLRRRGAVVTPPSNKFCLNTKHHKDLFGGVGSNPTAATNVMSLPGVFAGTLVTEILPGLTGFGNKLSSFKSQETGETSTIQFR